MLKLSVRVLAFGAILLALGACAAKFDPNAEAPDLGNFRLGHNIVLDDNATVGPASRVAEPGVWETVFEAEIDKQLGEYQGEKLYHLGISVNGYALAGPGIPIIASPKSVVIFSVTLWDNATQSKINDEPKQFTVFESTTETSVLVGTGLTQSKEQQLDGLAKNATRALRNWLAEQPELFEVSDGGDSNNTADPAAEIASEAVAALE